MIYLRLIEGGNAQSQQHGNGTARRLSIKHLSMNALPADEVDHAIIDLSCATFEADEAMAEADREIIDLACACAALPDEELDDPAAVSPRVEVPKKPRSKVDAKCKIPENGRYISKRTLVHELVECSIRLRTRGMKHRIIPKDREARIRALSKDALTSTTLEGERLELGSEIAMCLNDANSLPPCFQT